MEKRKNAALKTKKIMDLIEYNLNKIFKFFTRSFKKLLKEFKNADGEINFEFLFEFFVKLLFLFFVFFLLKMPFHMVQEIGTSLFRIFISPFNHIFLTIWKILIGLFYFITCLILFFLVFQKYFTIKKIPFLSILKKIFLSVFIFFPAWCLNIALLCIIFFLFYLLIKGISVLGLLFIFIGSSLLLGYMIDSIKKVLDKKEVFFSPFLISLGFIIIGSLITIRDLSSYQYYQTLENSPFEQTAMYEIDLQKFTTLESPNGSKEIIINNTLKDNQIKVEIIYYDSYNIRKEENRIIFYAEHQRSKKEIFNRFLEDLKNKKIYNYSSLNDCNIKIYVNEYTRNFIN